jgi:hypothetical protein
LFADVVTERMIVSRPAPLFGETASHGFCGDDAGTCQRIAAVVEAVM